MFVAQGVSILGTFEVWEITAYVYLGPLQFMFRILTEIHFVFDKE